MKKYLIILILLTSILQARDLNYYARQLKKNYPEEFQENIVAYANKYRKYWPTSYINNASISIYATNRLLVGNYLSSEKMADIFINALEQSSWENEYSNNLDIIVNSPAIGIDLLIKLKVNWIKLTRLLIRDVKLAGAKLPE